MRQLILISFLVTMMSACGGGDPAKTETAESTPEVAATTGTAAGDATKSAEACTLTLGWESYEPYQFRDISGEVRGLDVDLVKALANRAGCEVEMKQGDWSDLLQGIRTGELNLIASATRTEEREEYALFSNPYREEAFSVYVRAGEGNKWAAESLAEMVRDKKMRIGLIDGYVYGADIDELLGNPELAPQFISASFSESHAANLLDGKIDGLMEDAYVADAMIRRKNLGDRMERLPFNFHKGDVTIMFSKANVSPELVTKFNEAITAIKADGTYESIVKQYRK